MVNWSAKPSMVVSAVPIIHTLSGVPCFWFSRTMALLLVGAAVAGAVNVVLLGENRIGFGLSPAPPLAANIFVSAARQVASHAAMGVVAVPVGVNGAVWGACSGGDDCGGVGCWPPNEAGDGALASNRTA